MHLSLEVVVRRRMDALLYTRAVLRSDYFVEKI